MRKRSEHIKRNLRSGKPDESRNSEPPCREAAVRATPRVAKPPNEKNRLQTTQLNDLQKPQNEKNRLQITQANELQNRRTKKPAKKTPEKQNNYPLSILPRHYAASGLLNLPAALTRPFPQKLRAESSKRA